MAFFRAGDWMPLAGASPFWTVKTSTQLHPATHYLIQEIPMLSSYEVCTSIGPGVKNGYPPFSRNHQLLLTQLQFVVSKFVRQKNLALNASRLYKHPALTPYPRPQPPSLASHPPPPPPPRTRSWRSKRSLLGLSHQQSQTVLRCIP